MKNKLKKENHLRLNLGCGTDHRSGYVNVDVVKEVYPDLVHDLLQPLPFKDNSVDEIIAQDILEHFIYDDFLLVIGEISRLTKKGGKLFVRVPHIDSIFKKFDSDKEVRNIYLYGTTSHRTDTGIFGAHKIGFSVERLLAELYFFGLMPISVAVVDTNIEATFQKSEKPKLRKLLFFIQALSMGGSEQFDADLLSALSRKHIKIASYTNSYRVRELLLQYKVSSSSQIGKIPLVVDVIGNWKGLVKAIVTLPLTFIWYGKTIYFHKDSDVIVVSGFGEKILASFWAWLFGISLVWLEFGPLTPIFKKHFRLSKILYFLVKRFPQKVIVPSGVTFVNLITEARVSLAKLVRIPCGTSLVAKTSNSRSSSNTIVCVSRLEPGKGQDLLLQAFSIALRKNPTLRLQIIGEGDFLPTLIALARDLNIEKSVAFLNHVPDVRPYLLKAAMVAFPSVWKMEGFGLVAIEAMAAAKPVVGFDRAPINEIVVADRTGLLVPEGDITKLATAIQKLASSRKLQHSLGKEGRKRYLRMYSLEKIAPQYEREFLRAFAWKKAESLKSELLGNI